MDSTSSNRPSSKDTAEYKVIQKLFDQLVEHSKTSLSILFNKLFSSELLTHHEHGNLLESHKQPYDNATDLIRIILTRVEKDSSNFTIFVSSLRHCELDQVADDLETSFGRESLTLPPASPTSTQSSYHNISGAEQSDPVATYDTTSQLSAGDDSTSDVFSSPHGQEHFKAPQQSGVPSDPVDGFLLDGGVLPEGNDKPLKYPVEDSCDDTVTVLQRSNQPTQSGRHNSDMVTKQLSHHVFHGHHQENVYPNLKRLPTSQSSSYRWIKNYRTTNTARTNCQETPRISSAFYKAPDTSGTSSMGEPYSAPSAPDTYGSTTYASHVSTKIWDSRGTRQFSFDGTSIIEDETAYYKQEAAHREDENNVLKDIIWKLKRENEKQNQALIKENTRIQDLQKQLIEQCQNLQAQKTAAESRLRNLRTTLVDAKHSESEAKKRATEVEKDMEESTRQYEENIGTLTQQLRQTREVGVQLCARGVWDQLLSEKEAKKRDKMARGVVLKNVKMDVMESASKHIFCVTETKRWSCEVGHMQAQDEALPVQDVNNDLLKRLEALDLSSDRL